MIIYKDKEYYNSKDLALAIIGGKWKVPIVWYLLKDGSLRLSELCRYMPNASQRMLIKQLRELEADDIITRKVYPVVPPKVEYELTPLGKKLKNVVNSICDWGNLYIDSKHLNN